MWTSDSWISEASEDLEGSGERTSLLSNDHEPSNDIDDVEFESSGSDADDKGKSDDDEYGLVPPSSQLGRLVRREISGMYACRYEVPRDALP